MITFIHKLGSHFSVACTFCIQNCAVTGYFTSCASTKSQLPCFSCLEFPPSLLSCEAPASVCVSHFSIVIFSLTNSLITDSLLFSRLLFFFTHVSIDSVIIYLHPRCIFNSSQFGGHAWRVPFWECLFVRVGRWSGSFVPRTRQTFITLGPEGPRSQQTCPT